MSRISSYLLVFSGFIASAIFMYYTFLSGTMFSYLPYWFKMSLTIIFFILMAKFMEMIGNEAS